jgi:hypothetical protein
MDRNNIFVVFSYLQWAISRNLEIIDFIEFDKDICLSFFKV